MGSDDTIIEATIVEPKRKRNWWNYWVAACVVLAIALSIEISVVSEAGRRMNANRVATPSVYEQATKESAEGVAKLESIGLVSSVKYGWCYVSQDWNRLSAQEKENVAMIVSFGNRSPYIFKDVRTGRTVATYTRAGGLEQK